MLDELMLEANRDEEATRIQVAKARAAQIAGLRELATFLEAHPHIEMTAQRYLVYLLTRDALAAVARIGKWDKAPEGDYFMLRKVFSGGITLDVFTEREKVCRKIITGQRIVPAQPAMEAHVEDVTEWICEDASLLAAHKPATVVEIPFPLVEQADESGAA